MSTKYSILALFFIAALVYTTLLTGYLNEEYSQDMSNRDQSIDSTEISIGKNNFSFDSDAAQLFNALQQSKKSQILQYFYSKKLNPNNSNYSEQDTAVTQSNKVSQIHWKEFTEARNSEFARAGYSTPETLMQIASDLGETTAWGILAVQAFENGNNANFIASSFALAIILQKKYGLLDYIKFWDYWH